MNALAASDPSNAYTVSRLPRLRAAAFIILSLVVTTAFALDAEQPSEIVAQADSTGPLDANRPQFEVSSSSLPRFDNTDGTNRSNRIDMTWMPPLRSAIGLSLGMTGTGSSSAMPFAPFAQQNGLTPNGLDLGLTWRYTLDSNYRVDVTAWRRLTPADALTMVRTREPSYGARVEMRLGGRAPKGGFVAERGFLGLQLESGARLTLRRSGGKPMLYYRNKF